MTQNIPALYFNLFHYFWNGTCSGLSTSSEMELVAHTLKWNLLQRSGTAVPLSLPIRGVQKVQNLRFFKTGLGRSCVYSKSNLWIQKISFWTIPDCSRSVFVVPGALDHLVPTQQGQIGPKLKIYVETIYCDHFVFHQKFVFVSDF